MKGFKIYLEIVLHLRICYVYLRKCTAYIFLYLLGREGMEGFLQRGYGSWGGRRVGAIIWILTPIKG
jgi:hypothetical protein